MEPCWPLFPLKLGKAVATRPPFCWVYVIFRFFGRPGSLLAQVSLDFGWFDLPFWRFLGFILEVSDNDLDKICFASILRRLGH